MPHVQAPGDLSLQVGISHAEGPACGRRRCAQAACGGSGKAVGCAGPLGQLLRVRLLRLLLGVLLMRRLLVLLLLLLLQSLLLLLEVLRVLAVRLKGCKPWS